MTKLLADLDQELAGHREVVNAILRVAIPYLPDEARLQIDIAVREISDNDAHPLFLASNLTAIASGALLPVHTPSWNGVPPPPGTPQTAPVVPTQWVRPAPPITRLPFGRKACPDCGHINWHDAAACKDCGVVFGESPPPATLALPTPPETLPLPPTPPAWAAPEPTPWLRYLAIAAAAAGLGYLILPQIDGVLLPRREPANPPPRIDQNALGNRIAHVMTNPYWLGVGLACSTNPAQVQRATALMEPLIERIQPPEAADKTRAAIREGRSVGAREIEGGRCEPGLRALAAFDQGDAP